MHLQRLPPDTHVHLVVGQVSDVQEMLETLSIDQEGMWSCIGSSGHTSSDGPAPGGDVDEDEDLHGRSSQMAIGRRGM